MKSLRLLEIHARIYAAIANIEGMKVDNYEREKHGLAMAWTSDMFFEVQGELEGLADELKKMGG